MKSMTEVNRYISKHADSLAVEVVESAMSKMQLDISDWEKEQAIKMYVEVFSFLGEYLFVDECEKAPEALLEWSKKNSEMQAMSGGDINEILVRYPPTREVFIEIITRISIELNLSVAENAAIIKHVNKLLDISLNETFYSYIRLSNQYKADKESELLKLSAPIVPVQNDIVIVPIIGYINSNVARHVLDNVIPKIAEMEVNYVIADFSGALTLNTEIAAFLHQLAQTLSLMGVQVITTGLRADIVQSIVNGGMEIRTVRSFATVKQALENLG